MLPAQTAQGMVRTPASEEQLWSYLVQLASGEDGERGAVRREAGRRAAAHAVWATAPRPAFCCPAALRSIHQAGLAARPPCLAPSKVLLTSAGRVRIGSLGIPDALAEGPPPDLAAQQREDLSALGSLLLLLACVGRGAAPSLANLTTHFSRELCHVVAGLLAAVEGASRGSASPRRCTSGARRAPCRLARLAHPPTPHLPPLALPRPERRQRRCQRARAGGGDGGAGAGGDGRCFAVLG